MPLAEDLDIRKFIDDENLIIFSMSKIEVDGIASSYYSENGPSLTVNYLFDLKEDNERGCTPTQDGYCSCYSGYENYSTFNEVESTLEWTPDVYL